MQSTVVKKSFFTGANTEALAVAHACGAHFIRAEGFVFSHVADEGWMDSCAGELLRYRRSIDADKVLVLTDIKKKHWSDLGSTNIMFLRGYNYCSHTHTHTYLLL